MKADITYKEETETNLKIITNEGTNKSEICYFVPYNGKVISLNTNLEYSTIEELRVSGNYTINNFSWNNFSNKELNEIIVKYGIVKQNYTKGKSENQLLNEIYQSLFNLNISFNTINFYNKKDFELINVLNNKIEIFEKMKLIDTDNKNADYDSRKCKILSEEIFNTIKPLYEKAREMEITTKLGIISGENIHFIGTSNEELMGMDSLGTDMYVGSQIINKEQLSATINVNDTKKLNKIYMETVNLVTDNNIDIRYENRY